MRLIDFCKIYIEFCRDTFAGSRTDDVDRLLFTVIDLRNAFVSQGYLFLYVTVDFISGKTVLKTVFTIV